MIRKSIATAVLALAAAHAQASLVAGDLVFTSFNADEDGWSLVALANIAANTTVYFTDNEWNGSAIGAGGAFNGGESYHQWLTGASSIAAGTVIRFSAIDSATNLAASVGSLSRVTVSGSNNYGISQSADTIYAYLGTSPTAPTSFLSAISSGAFSATEGQLVNTGLANGVNAIQLSNASDFAEYTGARDTLASFGAYRPLVANVANWSDLGDGAYSSKVPNTTAFSVVPVPGALPLMISAIAGVFFSIRRRRN